MSKELYLRYRPKKLADIIGQGEAVRSLQDMIDRNSVPHAILFTGPSGVGKTTIARILKRVLNCSDMDFAEINAADTRGIDSIRDIRNRMSLSPVNGKCRIWLMDEVHSILGPSQNAFLKMLEDTPNHVYFFLATTDPQKLLKTVRTRCTEIRLNQLTDPDIQKVLISVLDKEESKVSKEVIHRIVEVSEGSARKALVLLHQVVGLESEKDQLNAILSSDSKKTAIEIARALINPKAKWIEVAPILKACDEEPETIRHLILSYCTTILLGGGALCGRAALIINRFESPFYDSKKPGLVLACYETMMQK